MSVASVLRSLAVALSALGLVLAGATATAAHDALVGTDPADGSTVPAPPETLALEFSQPVLALGAAVVVTGPDGAVVSDGEPRLVDATVEQDLADGLPAGAYAVRWQVTSGDGHPITGDLTFTAATAAPGDATSRSAADEATSGGAAGEATSSEASGGATPGTTSDEATPSPGDGDTTVVVGPSGPAWLGAVIAILAVLALAATGASRSRRRPPTDPDDT